ncbi:MAG: hypothetical protein WCJ39_08780 [bacterium]
MMETKNNFIILPVAELAEFPVNPTFQQIADSFLAQKLKERNGFSGTAIKRRIGHIKLTLTQVFNPSFASVYEYMDSWTKKIRPFVMPLLDGKVIDDQQQKTMNWIQGLPLSDAMRTPYVARAEEIFTELKTMTRVLPYRFNSIQELMQETNRLIEQKDYDTRDMSIHDHADELLRRFSLLLTDIIKPLNLLINVQKDQLPELQHVATIGVTNQNLFKLMTDVQKEQGVPVEFTIKKIYKKPE